MATVATGIPEGICTIENRASMPSSFAPERGTPITGFSVRLATTPGRAAAMPAPAI